MAYINPSTLNLTICNGLGIYQNADWLLPVRLTNRVNCVDTPIDLTGFVGECSIKKYAGDDEPLVMATVTIVDAADGEFTISLTANQTAMLISQGRTWKDVNTCQYDCYMVNSSTGERYRVLQGDVEISPCVTDNNDGE